MSYLANNFFGLIDEPRIYNRALSSGEIRAVYNSNLAKYDTNRRTFTYSPTYLFKPAAYNYIFTGTMTNASGTSYTVNSNFTTLAQSGQYISFT